MPPQDQQNNDKDSAERIGWHNLLTDYPWFNGEGKFPITAYSEFMPPPRLHLKPYGDVGIAVFDDSHPYNWRITELEEAYELRPGLEHLANSILSQLIRLGQGKPAPRISGRKGRNLVDNPYWPPELAAKAGELPHERYITLLPLALSRTQDDKGRIRWTFFGSSEQGPEKAFWKSFYVEPSKEKNEREFIDFVQRLLATVYNEKASSVSDLLSCGFRILPSETNTRFPYWTTNELPTWAETYLIDENANVENLRYLLTFRPFSHLTDAIKDRYLTGRLCIIPFPGSLVFWGVPAYIKLQEQLPTAIQASLLRVVEHRNAIDGIRVPQSGWLNEPRNETDLTEVHPELVVNTYRRTSRWDRSYRWEDETAKMTHADRVSQVLFSTAPNVLGLYDKPMARNAQIWTEDSNLLLNGPNASHEQIINAANVVDRGGDFRYRFIFPAMRIGPYEIYWHRPLVSYWQPDDELHPFKVLPNSPLGYFTAYSTNKPDLSTPLELWPDLLNRPDYHSAISHFDCWRKDLHRHQTTMNIIRLLDNWKVLGQKPLPRDFARQLLRLSKEESLDEWLDSLVERADEPEEGKTMQQTISKLLQQRSGSAEHTGLLTGHRVEDLPPPLTFEQTKGRDFEVDYWNDIVYLAHGKYVTKDNADVAQDEETLQLLSHKRRDLDDLTNYLIQRQNQAIINAGLGDQAFVGELLFHWHTDFDFPLFGGWKNDQEGHLHESNILVIIPGKDRSRAVILADHYDTAYMEDEFSAKDRARLAANGADDNFSATATLLLAAPIYLEMAKEGRLAFDVWLVHLTGEEFPADCMGARHLAQDLVEKTLKVRLQDGSNKDLSKVQVVGVFVLDMIAHNKESEQDVFQISPGRSVNSMALAYQAHVSNLLWNAWATKWNLTDRRGMGRSSRSIDPHQIPEIAHYPSMQGQVRPPDDPLSSLFNTDGQIFSDIGVPTVLIMENYDIDRRGYHDTHDTVENIDLDYGTAVARIAIETVARVATETE